MRRGLVGTDQILAADLQGWRITVTSTNHPSLLGVAPIVNVDILDSNAQISLSVLPHDLDLSDYNQQPTGTKERN